jgi:PAS domain S-box-containing protein
VVRGKIVGRITLDHTEAGFYQPTQEPILQALTQQISIAIENANLFRAEHDQRDIAETLRDIALALASRLELDDVLQLVLAQVSRVLPFDAAGIWLSKDGGKTFHIAARVGYDHFDADDAIDKLVFEIDQESHLIVKQVIIIPDTHASENWWVYDAFTWVRSWAAAPIIVDSEVIGQAAFDHTQPGFYNEGKHKAILESLATQISVAVGNARLFEAERRRRQEIEAVQRSSLSLTASLDLSAVLNAILEAAFDLTGAQVAYIFLYENDKLTVGGALEQHDGERVVAPLRQPRQNGLTYATARSGELIMIEDVQTDPIYQGKPQGWFVDLNAIMGIPLLIHERVVGVMNLTFRKAQDMRQVEMNSLQLLADQASVAIENASLYQAIQEHATTLESRVKKRTTELESERGQLGAILDGMAEGVIYNEGPRVIYTNQMFLVLTGCTQEDVADFSGLIQLISAPSVDSHELASNITEAIQQAKGWRGAVRLRHRNGKVFDASITSTPIQSTTGAVTIIRDISQEKALEAQKDRFISNASHELRTPLANLMTRLYLMKKTPERTPEHIEIMETVAGQMSLLVDDLLDFSRHQRGALPMQRAQIILQDVLDEVVSMQRPEAQRKQITLESSMPDVPVAAYLDTQRIRQVFTNLVVNAINYTNDGGLIWVRLAEGVNGLATIRIEYTGIGIAPDQMEQIFEPFFRAKEGSGVGTGLGLSISKEIVEAHGGLLNVESEEGKGSVFIVTLPLHEYQAVEPSND